MFNYNKSFLERNKVLDVFLDILLNFLIIFHRSNEYKKTQNWVCQLTFSTIDQVQSKYLFLSININNPLAGWHCSGFMKL